MPDCKFKFNVGDEVKDTEYEDNDTFNRQIRGEVVWLEEDGQFALKVDRSKIGLSDWVMKVIDWRNFTLA